MYRAQSLRAVEGTIKAEVDTGLVSCHSTWHGRAIAAGQGGRLFVASR